jgi:uncharacterized coiled-coil protein SlyX
MNDAERAIRLEERFTFLERHVADQDKAMLALAEDMASLRKDLASLRARLDSIPGPGESPIDERPPHY